MPARFKMIKYSTHANYSRSDYGGIDTALQEVAGHFDKSVINPRGTPYSLHTEYSAGARQFSQQVFKRLKILKECSHNGYPLLWHKDGWSAQFFEFITFLVGSSNAPTIIEIHPPFRDSCPNWASFLARYVLFEGLVRRSTKFADVQILLEHRNGASHGGFLVQSPKHIAELAKAVLDAELRLGFVLDIPQLITCLGADRPAPVIKELDKELGRPDIKRMIRSVHISGYDHKGDLSSLFGGRTNLAKEFLTFLSTEFFSDRDERYMVPEVSFAGRDAVRSMCIELGEYFEFH